MPMIPNKYRAIKGVIRYAIRIGKTPTTFTDSDLDAYCQELLKRGGNYGYICAVKSKFHRFLYDGNLIGKFPGISVSVRPPDYGIALHHFPPLLRQQVMDVLKWKQDAFAYGRPAHARIRPVTAKNLEALICRLYGFVVNIHKRTDVATLSDLMTEDVLAAFTEWSVNERKLNGAALVCHLRLLYAAVASHPAYKQLDFKWFPALMAAVPVEPESARRQRKTKKWLPYPVLESVVACIDAECEKIQKASASKAA